MKATIYLRIASVLTFTHAVLHTIGGVFGKIDPGPAAIAVRAMKSNQFLLMGNMRSFWDFYRGMGLALSISLTFESIVFWLLANLARRDAARLRPILWTFLFAYLVLSLNSYTYFFLGPVITEILIAACLGAAIVASRSESEVQIQAG